MSQELTRSQIDRLGDRLRKGSPTALDLELLDSFRFSFDGAQQTVVKSLRGLGLEPSGRIKTTASIVEKLKRERTRLIRLQDIAGCRVVVDRIAQQDRIAALLSERLPKTALIDRRKKPSHGYRAVHLVAEIDGRLVEIQVRTELQHLWAMWSETLAAAFDQSIKYGGGPIEIQQRLLQESDVIASLEAPRLVTPHISDEELTPFSNPFSAPFDDPWIEQLFSKGLLGKTRFVGGAADLIRMEQELKQRLIREILDWKARGQKT